MKRLGLMLAIVLLGGSAFATSNSDGSVDRIRFADRLYDYDVIDKYHVVVKAGPSLNYLLTLRDSCPTMRHGEVIGVSNTANTIYAGFDYVIARHGFRCNIERIDEVTEEQIILLKHELS